MSVQSSAGTTAAARPEAGTRRWPERRRIITISGYTLPFVVFFALCLFLARTVVPTSDAANNALQGWDLLHGHLLLHGWILGDATFYTFELPLFAVSEAFFGLTTLAAHVEAAAAYTIVAILGAAVAKNRKTGFEGAARVAVVLAILSASMTTGINSSGGTASGFYGPVLLLGEPNHTTTCAFLLAMVLLIQRRPNWAGTPWVLFVLLLFGQIGDIIVRFMFVGAIVLACGWRVFQTRDWRSRDCLYGVTALISIPAAFLLRRLMRGLGSYTMLAPPAKIAPPSQWLSHLNLTFQQIPQLFGVVNPEGVPDSHTLKVVQAICIPFGLIALALVAFAIVQVVRTWPRADQADQILLMGIATFIGGYALSDVVGWDRLHEFAGVMPVMAVLAARLVPTKLAATKVLAPVAVLAALVPLVSGVSFRPVPPNPAYQLATWLEAHNLHYGVAGYWESSAVTLASDNAVQVRPVDNITGMSAYRWEIQISWFDANLHDANFVIANVDAPGDWFGMQPGQVEKAFGAPQTISYVGPYAIMVYPFNILGRIKAVHPVPHSS